MSDLGVIRRGAAVVSTFETTRNGFVHDFATVTATAVYGDGSTVALVVTDLGVGINRTSFTVPLDAALGALVIAWTAGPTDSGGTIQGTDVATVVATALPDGTESWCTLERARVIARDAQVSDDDLAVAQAFVEVLLSPVRPGDRCIQPCDLPLLETAVGRQAGASRTAAAANADGASDRLRALRADLRGGSFTLDGESTSFGSQVSARDELGLDRLSELALSRLSWLSPQAVSVVANRTSPFGYGSYASLDDGARAAIGTLPCAGA